jgi:hypothetical protein
VAEQWFDHYHVSQNRRHLRTALVCAAIARECYAIVAEERIRLGIWLEPAQQVALAARIDHLARTLGDITGR